jgi:hypothetical protein
LGATGHLVPSGGKARQCRINLLNLFEAFLWNLRGIGKASLRRVGDTARKEVENGGRTMREFSTIKGLATVLLVTIISIVEPKSSRSNVLEGLPVLGGLYRQRQREGRAKQDKPF